MTQSLASLLNAPEQDRRALFIKAASLLDTPPSYVEKDFWVCLVLETLYNRLPAGHPKLLLKGGTSLSKAFSLIRRFSEDIDIVVYREDLGFGPDLDPTQATHLSNRESRKAFDQLRAACSGYIRGDLARALSSALGASCQVLPDDSDVDQQSLMVKYPSLFGNGQDNPYVLSQVKIEGGARSALHPSATREIAPYIADAVGDGRSFKVSNVKAIEPERTYLEKALIAHGAYHGYRDQNRLPKDKDRISRHYYDLAVLTDTQAGMNAVSSAALLKDVREHNLIAFRQAWKQIDKAVPGKVRLVPQEQLRLEIEKDYRAMQGMILGDPPPFDWVMAQLQVAEQRINRSALPDSPFRPPDGAP